MTILAFKDCIGPLINKKDQLFKYYTINGLDINYK